MFKKWLLGVMTVVLIVGNTTTTAVAAESNVVRDDTGFWQDAICEEEGEQIPVLQGEIKTDTTGNYQYEELGDGTVQIAKYVGSETEVVIPSELDGKKVTKINEKAFYNTQIVSVVMPNTVISVGNSAFSESKKLESVRISASVVELGKTVFGNCEKLITIEVDKGNASFVAEDNILYTKDKKKLLRCGVNKSKVIVPDGVEVIESSAFSKGNFSEVVLPEGLTRIETAAFVNDLGLVKVHLPESLEYIGSSAFASSLINEIYIPKNVTFIGENAFSSCPVLGSISVHSENRCYVSEDDILYTKDKKELVVCISSRDSVTIADGVEKIGRGAFSCRYSMKEVELPESLKEIADDAFMLCQELEEVSIPASVEKIGVGVFSSCNNLKKVSVLNKKCILGENGETVRISAIFPKTTVLYGYDGSTLEEYAKTYNRTFVSLGKGPAVIADVAIDSWQYSYVKYAIDNNLASGKGTDASGDIIFDPESKMTRAEFIQLLYNKEGKPTVTYENIFSDVPEAKWFTNAIVWGYKNNLVSGKGGAFDVNGNITREEVATMLYKYAANLKKYDTTGKADLSGYEDVAGISSWAVNNMKWAVQHNVMKGRGTKIAARDNASRAECITMLINFINEYEK